MAPQDAPARPRATRRRRGLVVLALSTIATLALVGLAELAARRALGREFVPGLPMGRTVDATAGHDPDLGWANRPGLRTRIVAPEFECSLTINSHGQRDREHELEPAEGVYRIVLLGDSIAWGWGVDDGQEFATLVEGGFDRPVEVVNLACPGYSTDQELLILERDGWRYEPDLVLLCFVLNDTVGNASLRGLGMPFAKPRFVLGPDGELVLENHPVPEPAGGDPDPDALPRWAQRLREHSALWQRLFPADAEAQLAASREATRDPAAAGPTEGSIDGPTDGPERRRREPAGYRARIEDAADDLVRPDAVTHRLLGRLAAACAARGVPLVAFSVAHHHDRYLYESEFEPPDAARGPAAASYRSHLARRLAEAGAALGFEAFSVDAAMLAGVAKHGDLHVGDGHLNALGNRIVAGRIVAELRARIEGR